ncbi:MAG: hypothetical protein KatS3mg087_1019 [Patescibacteria group bacterium]|nr:MAG: hypothetical protein KatS3mg087_1019 [Patescibacteria group bacterium]
MLESEVGNVRIWKDVEHQARYYIGIDASAGIGTDTSANSSCQVINVETKEIVAELTDNDIMIEELALLVKRMALHYNEAYVIWEANGYGMAFGKHLMQVLHYPYVYMRRQVTKAIEKLTNMPGWWSSPKEKLLLLNQFFIAIRTNNVKMWSKELIYELSEYIYTEDGSIEHIRRHGQGPHGDRVIAAALAYRGASDFLYVSAQKETQQATSIYCFAHRRRLHRISAENESW